MICSAALCPAPPLLARELTGADPVVPDLRLACRDAAAGLVRAQPDVIAVVGAARVTRTWDPGARLNPAVFAPALGSGGPPAAPAPLGLGARLLDQAGYAGRRILASVSAQEPAARCAELGAALAGCGPRMALLVMADGSARRGPRAPGYLDQRSAAFDARVERAVRSGDLDALMSVDPVLAGELMATGRPAWQVLSGAMRGLRPVAQIRYCDDPFGVAYLVASLELPGASREGTGTA